MTEILPAPEAAALAEYEQAVERGLSTFLDVGRALLAIRDGHLYRADHDTFESYCQVRWGMTERYARHLVAAAAVGTMVPIANERQARELAPLLDQPERLRETWEQVNEQTGGKPTAAAIRSIVRPEPTTITATTTEKTVEEFIADRDTGEVLSVEDWKQQEQVRDYIEDSGDLQRARLVATFARLVVQAGDGLPLLDVADVAPALNEDNWQQAVRLRRRLNDWFDALEAARPRGLRVVEGR